VEISFLAQRISRVKLAATTARGTTIERIRARTGKSRCIASVGVQGGLEAKP
jgi:hypothetical protein